MLNIRQILAIVVGGALLGHCAFLQAGETPHSQPGKETAEEQSKTGIRGKFDPKALQKVDVNSIVHNGFSRGKTDPEFIIDEAEEEIERIKANPAYSPTDAKWLARPWAMTKYFVELMREGKPLPLVKLFVQAMPSGVTSSGASNVFRGKAERAVKLMREIGLKDTANGLRWSELWRIMDRVVTPLGMSRSGEMIVNVDVVLGMNCFFETVYKQIYNVRTIERYCEHDLGDGRYVIVQDLVADNSKGAKPRAPKIKKRSKKKYYPISEQISITLIGDNKNGTFTLANFMSSKGQPLKPISGRVMNLIARLIDLRDVMEEDTIKNRKKWDALFQQEVLRPHH